jgi:hypothetical protein
LEDNEDASGNVSAMNHVSATPWTTILQAPTNQPAALAALEAQAKLSAQ